MKNKGLNEKQFLALLEQVLPKATPDAQLAASIYERVAREVQLRRSLEAFEKFCEEGSLPDVEPATVAELRDGLTAQFGEETVVVEPKEDGAGLAVRISLPDRTVERQVKVVPVDPTGDDEPAPRFVPFPVVLPEDPELVWVLARREEFPPAEAARSLVSIEEEFWLSKAGQKRLRDGTERSFAEFIANVPASALLESGLKRHYKEPEALTELRVLAPITGDGTTVMRS